MKFSQQDIVQIEKKGITINQVEDQIATFKRGNRTVIISSAATIGNGIIKLDKAEAKKNIAIYDDLKNNFKILNFIPASGAATRMFKELYVFIEKFDPEKDSLFDYLKHKKYTKLEQFLDKLDKLPFYKEAYKLTLKNYPNLESTSADAQKYYVIDTFLKDGGMDLGNYPKGLVPFHRYGENVATAFEEHLYEAALYASKNNRVNLHFTVSKDHLEKFQKEFNKIKERVEQDTNTSFFIAYSFQDPKTDTIAVSDSNEVFRTLEGELFFRPGGHGALIENLNNIDADLVFIKNIDNLVTKQHRDELALYKKMLGGKLLKLQQECFYYLEVLDKADFSSISLQQISNFMSDQLFLDVENNTESQSEGEKIERMKALLNRPLRICGMVKNEGEPGGGPFLVEFENGERSLQIVESAQIDNTNPNQNEIAQNATHFNPVDLVCGLKNYKGDKFDLHSYVDREMSFISSKTKDGKNLKALELPGLWNGAMAKWNTVFVEVPVSTFNPVKTVADLLKPSHQPK